MIKSQRFNGYALALNSAITSLSGALYWLLAAWLYDADQVGSGALLVSTMLSIGNAAQFNFQNILPKFLPAAGRKRHQLIALCFLASAMTALFISTGLLSLPGTFLSALHNSLPSVQSALVFVVATTVWTIYALFDNVLPALGKSCVLPLAGLLFSISKIVLLLALSVAPVFGLPIFASWIVPVPLLLIILGLIVHSSVAPSRHHENPREHGLEWRKIITFSCWDYLGTLATTAAIGIMPFLAAQTAANAGIAVFYLCWMISSFISTVSRSLGVSLLAELATAKPSTHNNKIADVFLQAILVTLGLAVSFSICAPLIISVFGNEYAQEGPALLRWLSAAAFLWGINMLYLFAARHNGNLFSSLAIQLLMFLWVCILGRPLTQHYGLAGIGYAWFLCQLSLSILIPVIEIGRSGPAVIGRFLRTLNASLLRHLELVAVKFGI